MPSFVLCIEWRIHIQIQPHIKKEGIGSGCSLSTVEHTKQLAQSYSASERVQEVCILNLGQNTDYSYRGLL
jgi:hypothetical protein